MESSLTFSRAHFGPPSWEQSHSTNFEHWVLLFYFRAVFQPGSRDEVGSVSLPECPVISQFVGNKAKGWISKRVFLENKARQIFRKTNISYPLKQSLTKISRRKILNENFSHFIVEILRKMCTAWKVSKYGVFSGLCFPVFGLQNLLSKSPHSLRIRENTNQKNIRVWTLFTQFENKKCGFLTKNVSLFH